MRHREQRGRAARAELICSEKDIGMQCPACRDRLQNCTCRVPGSWSRSGSQTQGEEKKMRMSNRLAAEFVGTFWLVLGGCGSAVLAAAFPGVGIGLLGVSFAFGLTVLTMAYAIGHISGCHLNPAVSVGLMVGGRFKSADLIPYVVAQVLGAVAAAA